MQKAYTNVMKTDNVIVNKQGRPTKVSGEDAFQYTLDNPIGNIEPDLLMSVSPSFTYKGFTLSALFDMKFGGRYRFCI